MHGYCIYCDIAEVHDGVLCPRCLQAFEQWLSAPRCECCDQILTDDETDLCDECANVVCMALATRYDDTGIEAQADEDAYQMQF